MNKNKTTFKLLQLLADGRFHSGQDLGKRLNITRSGIWKAIKQLEALNIEVHAVTGKGYRIPDGIELLNETTIQQQLSSQHANKINQVLLLSTTPSTNDYLLGLAKHHLQQNIVVSAEHQTAGRGRHGRQWVSSFGSSLYQSLLWHFAKDPTEIVGLSLAVGVSIIRSLTRYGIKDGLQLKWPNDVLWHGRKLSGILIDMLAESHGNCSVIIGIGMNVRIPYHLGKSINQPWVDIAKITQQPPKRNVLAGLLLDELINTLETFHKNGLKPFLQEWLRYDSMIGNQVILSTEQDKIYGVLQGISATGELILLTQDNEKKYFLSGEVSLRLS